MLEKAYVLIAHDTYHEKVPADERVRGARFYVTVHEVGAESLTVGKNAVGVRVNDRHVPGNISDQQYDLKIEDGKLVLVTHASTTRPTWVNGERKIEKGTKGKLELMEGDTACTNMNSNEKPYLYIHFLNRRQKARLWELSGYGTREPTLEKLEILFKEIRKKKLEERRGKEPVKPKAADKRQTLIDHFARFLRWWKKP